jgi:hypothetical protein
MGSRIALMLASSGGEVRLYDRTPISWRAPDATSKQNCLGLWQGAELFQVVWFSRGPSKPPLLTLGWLWKRYQSGWITRERCLAIWIV